MSLSEMAKEIYDRELRAILEANHFGDFVAIEPVTKSFFVGDSFISAAMAAKEADPSRRSFVLRIGHETAFHLGAAFQ